MIEHYNTIILSATGSPDSNIVEAALCRHESKAAALFQKIENRSFKTSDKEAFARWMSIQMTSVPCYRDWVLDLVKAGHGLQVERAYALAHVEDRHYDLFLELEWGFMQAPADANFVTSDNPVYVCNAGVVYPLNRKLALALGNLGKEGLTEVDAELGPVVNSNTVKGAYRCIYASECLARLAAC